MRLLTSTWNSPLEIQMNEQVREAVNFLETLGPAAKTADQIDAVLRRKLGSAFEISEYTVGGYEVPLNRIIADLLNPRGPHGQGALFLRLFLRQLLPNYEAHEPGQLSKWRAALNHGTAGGRYVDIALFHESDLVIYIESKPWATEGYNQLRDYKDDLAAKSFSRKVLVFLPGVIDRKPQTVTEKECEESNVKLITMPFQEGVEAPSIIKWIDQCSKDCEADNVRLFLRDLASYLRRKFPNVGTDLMAEDSFVSMMVPNIVRSPHYLQMMLKFEPVIPEVKKRIAETFFERLRAELVARNTDWQVDYETGAFEKQWGQFAVRKKSWWKEWYIGLQTDKNYNGFIIGFCCPTKEGYGGDPAFPKGAPIATEEHQKDILGAITSTLEIIGGGRVTKDAWWAGYCRLPNPLRDWDNTTYMLIGECEKMLDGRSAIETFADWFQRLIFAVGSTVDGIMRGYPPPPTEAGAPMSVFADQA